MGTALGWNKVQPWCSSTHFESCWLFGPFPGCFSPSFIIGYQWVDKENSFAFLHFACGVSWLPALPFPVQGPQEDPLRGRARLRSVAAARPLSHRLRLWRGRPWPVGDSPCGCIWLLMSFLVAEPSHQHPLFFQAALGGLTLVFLASQALRSFSSLGLAVSFSFETVWELNLNLINNI